jgi:N-methylhydantoinase B
MTDQGAGIGSARGAPAARIQIGGVDDEPIAPTSAPDLTFRPGQVVRLQTPGGAGHGDPAERAATSIEADLRDGRISAAAADRDYGRRS